MSTKAKTETADFVFAVKEHGDGTPWIMLEARREGLSAIKNGFLGLRLLPGTDIVRAQEIAEFLNDNIESVSCTQFI